MLKISRIFSEYSILLPSLRKGVSKKSNNGQNIFLKNYWWTELENLIGARKLVPWDHWEAWGAWVLETTQKKNQKIRSAKKFLKLEAYVGEGKKSFFIKAEIWRPQKSGSRKKIDLKFY